MSRIMTVRNDEELKYQRKIGIVGVRRRQTTPGIKLTNIVQIVDESLALGGNPMSVNYTLIQIFTLMISSSPRRVQFLRNCSLRLSDTLNRGHHLPSDLVVHASPIPTWNGEFFLFQFWLLPNSS